MGEGRWDGGSGTTGGRSGTPPVTRAPAVVRVEGRPRNGGLLCAICATPAAGESGQAIEG